MPMRPRVHNPFSNTVRNHQDKARATKEHERQLARLNPHQRGYTRQWREVSRHFLQANPLCKGPDSYCDRSGRRVPSRETDHIVPHRGNLRLFWDQNNWQALCRTCHARKTAAEDGGFGRPVTSKVIQHMQATQEPGPSRAPKPEPKRKPEQPITRTPTREPSKRPEPQPPYTKRTTSGMRAADMTEEQIHAEAGPQHTYGVVRSNLRMGTTGP